MGFAIRALSRHRMLRNRGKAEAGFLRGHAQVTVHSIEPAAPCCAALHAQVARRRARGGRFGREHAMH